MNGHMCISKLLSFNIPGAELLKANDLDWVFLEDCSQVLSNFWIWFFTHVSPEDVLSDVELNQYSELLSSGLVLSERHLRQIENCSEAITLDEDSPNLYFALDGDLDDEVEILEKRLKRLKERKSSISLQKMEADANLEKRCLSLQQLCNDLEKEKRPVQHVCTDYSRTVEEISTSIEAAVSPFLSFMCGANEAKFLRQVSNNNWCENEMNFREALFKYIHKQFQEGIESFLGQKDEYQCLLDSTQLGLQFVRGPKHTQYLTNTKDLHRLGRMLEEAELNTIDLRLEKAQREAEMNEAIKFQRMLSSKKSNSLSFIKEQISCLEESIIALEQDLQFQKDYLKEVGIFISETEGLRVLSVNYEFKLQRQEYFLSKLKIVRDFLVDQLSRVDLMKIMYDIEQQMISTILDILVNLNKGLREEYEGSTQRLDEVKRIKDSFLKNGSVAKERDSLRAILKDMDNGNYTEKSDGNLWQIVKASEASLKNSENELKVLAEYRMSQISRLFRSCSVLEECLFGTSNSISNIPESWVSCKISDRQAKIEQNMWTLQQEMFQVLKSYEKKKKLIKDKPSFQENLVKWTHIKET